MPQMRLIPYSDNSSYPESFEQNFHAVEGIARYASVDYLLRLLSSRLGIPYDVLLIELKRYILTRHEYNPCEIAQGWRHTAAEAVKFFGAMLVSVFRRRKITPSRLVIDEWTPGAMTHFYGQELVESLRMRGGAAVIHGKQLWGISLRHCVCCLGLYMREWFPTRRATRETGINLSGFVKYVVRAAAAGYTLRDSAAPAVVLSGNDNGFPVIIAAASGARLVLIQNARKTLFSEASFKYADILIAMADLDQLGITDRTGCVFRSMFPLGSIRLAHALLEGSPAEIPSSDIVWISDLEYAGGSEETFGRYYSMRNELAAIRLLIALAERTRWKIIFKCRNDGEQELLKSLGLYADNITYIGRSEMNTYQVCMKAGVVLSTISSVVMEMMGVGKRGGFVNLSGNRNVNADLFQFGIEYTRNDVVGLQQFVEHLRTVPATWQNAVRQSPDYDASVIKVLEGIV